MFEFFKCYIKKNGSEISFKPHIICDEWREVPSWIFRVSSNFRIFLNSGSKLVISYFLIFIPLYVYII